MAKKGQISSWAQGDSIQGGKKMKTKRTAIVLLILGLMLFIAACGSKTDGGATDIANNPSVSEQKETTREIVDLAGRTVSIPNSPQHIATIEGPSFEKIIMLGGGERIAITRSIDFSKQFLIDVFAPYVKTIPTVEDPANPNIEELLSLGVDVVFYRDSYPEALAKLEEAGIPVVVTQILAAPETNEEFFDLQKKEMRVIAQVLGGEAIEKAEKWCNYFDEKVSYVTSRTNDVSTKPSMYYIKGPTALDSFVTNSYITYWAELAGAENLSVEFGQQVTMEQIIKWNPQFVFMGRVGDKALITNDPSWASISAVVSDNISVNPVNVQWDYSSQGILQLQIMAKTLHPELFKDLDIPSLIKTYYSAFYGFEPTDAQISEIYIGQ